jgi:eukaryotic-like serine/threonine-protein kinase
MALKVGERLGPYEILAPIGAGGMGQVWKARDTRLDRIVAIKTVAAQFSPRFEREARLIAALNHPHICQIYDLGPDYLVMEYIEGKPLAGPLPVEQAIEYGAQVCDALAAAHRKGIVHRDLKPDNILVTKSGVKLLDFGIAHKAKALAMDDATVTQTLSQPGTIAGTLQYMSPEQLEGKEAGPASDIFSFGCVFYEVITGQRAFEAASAASLIAAILAWQPQRLNPVQPALQRILDACLAKDPDERWQSARDLKRELKWISKESTSVAATARSGSPRMWIAATMLATVVAAAGWIEYVRTKPEAGMAAVREWKLSVTPPPGTEFPEVGDAFGATPEISPDGSMLLCAAGDRLRLRRLNSPQFAPLSGTHTSQPFWSPDSQWIGYFSGNNLMKMRIPDGAPEVVTTLNRNNGAPRGATWSASGDILFAAGRELRMVPASAGKLTIVLAKNEKGIERPQWPHFLPDGEHFIFSARDPSLPEDQVTKRGIYLAAWKGNWTRRPVLLKSNLNEARYSPARGGSLLYVQNDSLYAQRLNVASARLEGDPDLVQANVATSVGFIASHFSVSPGGVLAWRPGMAALSQLTWFDRAGKAVGTVGPPGDFFRVALSPDERRVAVLAGLGSIDEHWVMETGQNGSLKISHRDQDSVFGCLWSRDNAHILSIWSKGRGESGSSTLMEQSATGTAEARVLRQVPGRFLEDITVDRKFLLYGDDQQSYSLPLEGDGKPRPLVQSNERASNGMFSPDGRWVVYQSGGQVLAQTFPVPGPRKQLSSTTGGMPVWRSDGKEILYLGADNRLWSVRADPARGEFGAPEQLFAVHLTAWTIETRSYAVTRDGSRILFGQMIDQPGSNVVNVAVDWTAVPKK